jgi:two-component system nitrate/nitrite response regulator NarL
MRILIAERHALPRAGIAELITTGLPDSEVFQARDLTEARLFLGSGQVDVCVIEIGLLRSHDERELTALRIDFPALKLIVRLDKPEREVILTCFRLGAHGCITERSSAADLLGAVCCVASGAVAVPAAIADPPTPATTRCEAGGFDREAVRLTKRQTEVLNLLGEGRSTKDIARRLDLSVGTIKVHLGSIFRILGARNRVEAALKARGSNYGPRSLGITG